MKRTIFRRYAEGRPSLKFKIAYLTNPITTNLCKLDHFTTTNREPCVPSHSYSQSWVQDFQVTISSRLNHRAISRFALSTESLPWTMFLGHRRVGWMNGFILTICIFFFYTHSRSQLTGRRWCRNLPGVYQEGNPEASSPPTASSPLPRHHCPPIPVNNKWEPWWC